MEPSESSTDESGFVYCGSCGAKAASSWSFCRSCEESLDEPVSATEAKELRLPPGFENRPESEYGCPKCGHTDAEVDDIATTGTEFSKLFNVQNRRFRVVSCTRCGYSEFYRGGDTADMLDLFLG